MTHHVAIAYPDHSRANEVIAALKRLEAEGAVELKKAVAVTARGERKYGAAQIIGQTLLGTLLGGIVGVGLGLIFSDLWLGVIIGAVVGTLVGIMIGFARGDEVENYGFGAFGEQVGRAIPKDGAAVLMVVRKNDPEKAIATLQQYGGTVIQTTLPTELETRLRSAVGPEPLAA